MNKKLNLFLIGITSLLILSSFKFSSDPIADMLKRLEDFAKKYPQEKVYLHLDKPYYAIGDDIWFKAYVTDSRTAAPSAISNILYVELINEKDSIQKLIKLPMQTGIAWGDFKLADSLNEGNYRIRAYTQWMRNAGPDFFFDKHIKIGNSWANDVFTQTNYQLSREDGKEKAIGTVQFTDKNNKPYINSTISYKIEFNDKIISTGKGTTSKEGKISIPILNSKPERYKSGNIVATIKMPDGKSVVKNIPIKTTSDAVDVQFFPEGGKLVEGLPARIGVKSINNNGLGENISGTITDNEGAEILTFETTYLGMGSVFFTPETNKKYTANITTSMGNKQVIELPKAEKSGYTLAVNNTDSAKMTVRVMVSKDLVNAGALTLVAQHNGNVYFIEKLPADQQITKVVMPDQEMLSGIVQITLFSPENFPVAERSAFVNNSKDKIELDMNGLNENYLKKDKINLSLAAKGLQSPVKGSFSVSVTNTSLVTPDIENESNIMTELLLTPDLVGFVEKPNHYFLNKDLKTRKELDNLLLTQGWRKIDWKKFNSSELPDIDFPAEKTLKISGIIKNGKTPMPKSKVLLLSSKGFLPLDTLTDENGRFSFENLVFNDSAKFVVQARTEKGKSNINIEIDTIPNQALTLNKNTGDVEVNVNASIFGYLKQSGMYFDEKVKKFYFDRVNTLKEIEKKAKMNPEARYSVNFNGVRSGLVTLKEIEAWGVNLSLSKEGIIVRNDKAYSIRNPKTPLAIYLDDVLLGTSIEDIVMANIESVEIFKGRPSTSIGANLGGSGLRFISKKGRNSYDMFAPGIISYAPKGYYVAREFYSPKYEVATAQKQDYRTTVYWNPNLVSDADGKFNLNYFNTDKSGTYRILVEGIDAEGKLARKTFAYKVN